MFMLARYLVGTLNVIAFGSIFWYPYANIVASTTSRIEALAAIIPSLLMYSAFALMSAYAFIKGMRTSKTIWNIGFSLNSIILLILFVLAAYIRISSSSQAQAGAAEFVRLLIPFVFVLTINLFLLFKNASGFSNKT